MNRPAIVFAVAVSALASGLAHAQSSELVGQVLSSRMALKM